MFTNEVIIYQAPPKTEKDLSKKITPVPQKGINKSFLKKAFIIVGNFLLLIALVGLFFTYGPLFKSEINYQVKKRTRTIIPKIGFGQLLKMEVGSSAITAPDVNFSLVIPKINARSRIIHNVDASDKKDYSTALKKGVAHAKGTVFPGMKGTIMLFAHSTDAPWNIVRYNAIFYLLRELEQGDQIIIFFQGKRFNYRVIDKKIVSPTETSFFSQKNEELLVLQTCYPPGTTKKALLVYAKRVSDLENLGK